MNTSNFSLISATEPGRHLSRRVVTTTFVVLLTVLGIAAFSANQGSAQAASSGGQHPQAQQATGALPPLSATPCSERPQPGDLRARITDSPSSTSAHFTNRSATCSYHIGLAVYQKFDNNIENQELYDF